MKNFAIVLILAMAAGAWGGRFESNIKLEKTDLDFMASLVSTPRVARSYPIPKFIEACDDATAWSGTRCTLANDTVNVVCGGSALQSVKITPTSETDCSMTHTYAPAKDLSASHMYVRFYIDPSTVTGLNKIYLYLMTSGTDFNGYKIWDIAGAARASHAGWNEWSGTLSSIGVTGGSPNLASIAQLRIRLEYTAASVPNVTVDEIRFTPKLAKAKYCFTFDDGWATQYEASAYLLSKGMRGTFYVIPTSVGRSGYLTLDQLKKMRAAGHLIANHSYNHYDDPLLWAALSDTQKKYQICAAIDWMCKNGFSDGARIFAVPLGQWSEADNNLIRDRYVQQVRGTYNSAYAMIPQTLNNPTLLYGSNQNNSTTAGTVLTNAIADGAVAINFWHYWTVTAGETLADFKTHVDAVAVQRDAGNIDVVTMIDLLN